MGLPIIVKFFSCGVPGIPITPLKPHGNTALTCQCLRAQSAKNAVGVMAATIVHDVVIAPGVCGVPTAPPV